jgi:hypothetical protein
LLDGLEEDASRMTSVGASVALATAWAVAGLALGAGYFAGVRRTAELLSAGGDRVMPAALTLARFIATALCFAAAARYGALSLLSAFLGFLVARRVALRGAARVA